VKIERKFTQRGRGPYVGIEWVSRTSELRAADGRLLFNMEDIIVPAFWSQIATDVLAQKYFRKAGVPADKEGSWTAFIPESQRILWKPRADGSEHDARQVFHRLAWTWTEWGRTSGYFDSKEDAEAFYDETLYMLAHQMAAPNSPQWFNTGLFAVYGVEGPAQGHYYVDPDTGDVTKSSSAYSRPQPHACFILDIKDDLVNEGGIMDLITREARLFKYGSGTGTNFSKVRAQGESLSGGGVSSGLLSFLKVADRSAGAIKSGGTTRRAAKMVILDADHPDIEAFVQWKAEEEYKVACLAAGSTLIRSRASRLAAAARNERVPDEDRFSLERNIELRREVIEALEDGVPAPFVLQLLAAFRQGDWSAVEGDGSGGIEAALPQYDSSWEGAAYGTVSGQSSNNSVRLDNAFMKAVIDDGEWELKSRTNGSVVKKVKARALWKLFARTAWKCADPGLQFHTTINEWHTCPADGEIRASNPCSEYMFLDDTACNLASLRLTAFYDESSRSFDTEAYRHAIRLWTLILELSVVMAQFPSAQIARKSFDYRTLGLGFADLGSLLMLMGLAYDSDEGRALAAALGAILTGEAYAQSARMAAEFGPFARYEANREAMLRVIRNHRRAAYGAPPDEYEGLTIKPAALDERACPAYLVSAARESWDLALSLGVRHGFRNAQVTAIAPTGTIGLLMDCDTTGIEPDYALVKFKKLAGGGYFKIINRSVPPALRALGYSEEEIGAIERYALGSGTLRGSPLALSRENLARRGMSEEALDRIEAALKNAISLEDCFSRSIVGTDELDRLLVPREVRDETGFSLLSFLGYSDAEIEEAEIWACGTMGLEGAPMLREEHLGVFDTATVSGKNGTRTIPWKAHIAMMASVQSFISGAISKTINMPNSALYDDVEGAYMLAWKSMLKSIALYRDGSKLSQPLSALAPGADLIADSIAALQSGISGSEVGSRSDRKSATDGDTERPEPKVQELPGMPPSPRGIRRALPNRRAGYTQKAKIGGHSVFLRTGEYEDGSLGEIFLDMHKEGAAFRSILNSFAIAVSLGLQYGVPLEEYVDAFTFTRFEPNGVVQGHDYIKMATSVLDYVFRDLAISYLERHDLGQVKPEDLEATAARGGPSQKTASNGKVFQDENKGSVRKKAVQNSEMTARRKGYEGDPCPVCGHLTLVRNGTCLKCETCGSTTGCS
jgi:ribonucleoside-diphosphate reductase alpha chain